MSHILAAVTYLRDCGADRALGEAELVVGRQQGFDSPAKLQIGGALSMQDGGAVRGVTVIGGLKEDGPLASRVEGHGRCIRSGTSSRVHSSLAPSEAEAVEENTKGDDPGAV
jgi:hypothetical protein